MEGIGWDGLNKISGLHVLCWGRLDEEVGKPLECKVCNLRRSLRKDSRREMRTGRLCSGRAPSKKMCLLDYWISVLVCRLIGGQILLYITSPCVSSTSRYARNASLTSVYPGWASKALADEDLDTRIL